MTSPPPVKRYRFVKSINNATVPIIIPLPSLNQEGKEKEKNNGDVSQINTSQISSDHQSQEIFIDSSQNELFKAIEDEDIDDVSQMIEKSEQIDLNLRDYNGNNILLLLLKDTKDKSKMEKYENIALQLIEKLNNVESYINRYNRMGETALHMASACGYMKLVKKLLQKGAKINIFSSPYTPLMLATENGHLDIVKYLIKEGAEVNVKTWCGTTALLLSADHPEIMDVLIDKTDINATTNDGTSVLMKAVHLGSEDLVKKLIEKHVDINATNELGGTALLDSVIHGNEKIIKMLYDNGADPNLKKGRNTVTALDMAKYCGTPETIKMLSEN